MNVYTGRIRDALKGAVDTRALARAWLALYPQARDKVLSSVTKELDPRVAQFLVAARDAILAALRRVLAWAHAEGWVLGQQAAQALSAGLAEADWRGWTPGDHEAAAAVAGAGLRDLLDEAGIRIRSIADARVEELADVLEQTLASDVTAITAEGPLPPRLSVGDLTRQLVAVLDRPGNAAMVARSEIARAQSQATLKVYAEMGVREAEWATAEDARVCPLCDANEAAGPVPLGAPYPSGAVMPPQHPNCRCALIPVTETMAGAA